MVEHVTFSGEFSLRRDRKQREGGLELSPAGVSRLLSFLTPPCGARGQGVTPPRGQGCTLQATGCSLALSSLSWLGGGGPRLRGSVPRGRSRPPYALSLEAGLPASLDTAAETDPQIPAADGGADATVSATGPATGLTLHLAATDGALLLSVAPSCFQTCCGAGGRRRGLWAA
ncbi:hypothetical protein EYF80_061998 [Liparis tanakae]|uniref:Uncharacterized protein n=1 Tax=Liparis tanakae TaxID=230148 RepID=A0A4Z2EGE1_9TELE|nr:hypothetical protein EYF80_061998 [Liparis tanakae]